MFCSSFLNKNNKEIYVLQHKSTVLVCGVCSLYAHDIPLRALPLFIEGVPAERGRELFHCIIYFNVAIAIICSSSLNRFNKSIQRCLLASLVTLSFFSSSISIFSSISSILIISTRYFPFSDL